MNIYIQIFVTSFVLAIVLTESDSLIKKPTNSAWPTKEPNLGGFWKTKTQWKAYWVKDWVAKTIYVPVWKHVWGPAEIREWVPTGVAKPPPTGWRPPATIG